MIVRIAILLLCAGGLYASAFMFRKSLRARHGEIAGPTVVKTPRAHVIAGIPNSAFGLAYYAALAVATPFLHVAPLFWCAFAGALGAAAFSLYLAYSLLFVTRMSCPYCWSSHAINWSLVLLLWLARPQ